jgi:opacity protein-like surface antigen
LTRVPRAFTIAAASQAGARADRWRRRTAAERAQPNRGNMEMRKVIRLLAIACLALGMSGVEAAQGLDSKKLFFGAGLSSNSMSGTDSALGYQFFGGYNFGEVQHRLNLDLEVGYMDTGNMKSTVCLPLVGCVSTEAKAKGLWSTAVARYSLSPSIELLGRLGYDFGDDDGLMFGVGLGFPMSKQLTLRGEIVERDHVESLQFNAVFHFQ